MTEARWREENGEVGELLERFKPAAPVRAHLLLAGLMWSVVGVVLAGVGARWALGGGWRWAGVWLAVAVVIGVAKSLWVLDRAAGRIAGRIVARGDGRCLGGFLSWRSWLLVGVMAGGGRLLRGGLLARGLVGLLYLAVGTALLLSSRVFWRERARAGAGQTS